MRSLYLVTFIALVSTAIGILVVSQLGDFEYVSAALQSLVAYSDSLVASGATIHMYSNMLRQHRDSAEDTCDYLSMIRCFQKGGYNMTYQVYDDPTFECTCSLQPSEYLVTKRCSTIACPDEKPKLYYWPASEQCFCETEDFFTKDWNKASESGAVRTFDVDGGSIVSALARERQMLESAAGLRKGHELLMVNAEELRKGIKHTGPSLERLYENILPSVAKRQVTSPVGTPTSTPIEEVPAMSTFIPPPKIPITGQLINESLQLQPQNLATVSSIMPFFADGVITFTMQLPGIVLNQIPINASTAFPYGSIGVDPEPNIMIVPKYVQQGTSQTVIGNCMCIAVNVYNPNITTYWIQNELGEIYSLLGTNEVTAINQIDTSAPIAVNLLTTSPASSKRAMADSLDIVPLARRQVISVDCSKGCPMTTMTKLTGPDDGCACAFEEAGQEKILSTRSLTAPDAYSATMTEAACNGMICDSNRGKPAVFNPFSRTCWCVDAPVIEDNENAWSGRKKT